MERYEIVLKLGEAGDGRGETWSESQATSQAELVVEALDDDFTVELVLVRDGGQRFTIDGWQA